MIVIFARTIKFNTVFFSIKGILRTLKDILRVKNRYYSLNKFKKHFEKYYNELDVKNNISEIKKLNVIVLVAIKFGTLMY